jgi:hypothetical protein
MVLFLVLISAIILGIGGVRMLRTSKFTQEVEGYVVDPEHTFEIEMATQISELRQTYKGRKKSRAFLRELDRLHAEYHQKAVSHGWLHPFHSALQT